MHKAVDGVPRLQPKQFPCCAGCMIGNFKQTHIGKSKVYDKPPLDNNKTSIINDKDDRQLGISKRILIAWILTAHPFVLTIPLFMACNGEWNLTESIKCP